MLIQQGTGNRQQATGNSHESLFMAIFSLIVKLINLKYAVITGCNSFLQICLE